MRGPRLPNCVRIGVEQLQLNPERILPPNISAPGRPPAALFGRSGFKKLKRSTTSTYGFITSYGPAKLTTGNDESASPDGSPLIPALIGHCPSIVAFVIGTYRRETPKLTWFSSEGRITQLSLARATVGTSSTSRVSAYGSGI